MPTAPMPIELVLAAHDYNMPCLMSIEFGCMNMAKWLLYIGHLDGSRVCGPTPVLPLCDDHKRCAVFAAAGGPLADFLGAEPMPPCDECGKPIKILKVTTLKGDPA